jgi:hypothetical protein
MWMSLEIEEQLSIMPSTEGRKELAMAQPNTMLMLLLLWMLPIVDEGEDDDVAKRRHSFV